ncbi:MAG: sulfonate transport system permease protein [Clostridiales bacterium]|jgi:NitT/TauT family transport system permease protein|nr:sulfonate transport system permease protein [Clostridiales bacterium]
MNSKKKRRLYQVGFIGSLLAAWVLISELKWFPEALFPGPLAIMTRFFELILYDQLFGKTAYSIAMVFSAMAVSLILAIVLIALERRFEAVEANLSWISAVAAPLPGAAILPLVILWFGVSQRAMFFIMIHATLWPLWTQLRLSVDQLHRRFERFERAFGLPAFRRFWYIYCRGSKSALYAGLRVAWSRGWRALISAEMIFGIVGQYTGLGWLIYERRMYMDTSGLYAGLLAIALCGIFFETVLFREARRETDR